MVCPQARIWYLIVRPQAGVSPSSLGSGVCSTSMVCPRANGLSSDCYGCGSQLVTSDFVLPATLQMLHQDQCFPMHCYHFHSPPSFACATSGVSTRGLCREGEGGGSSLCLCLAWRLSLCLACCLSRGLARARGLAWHWSWGLPSRLAFPVLASLLSTLRLPTSTFTVPSSSTLCLSLSLPVLLGVNGLIAWSVSYFGKSG